MISSVSAKNSLPNFPDMKPGDIVYDDGTGMQKVNANDVLKEVKGMDFLKIK